MNISVSLALGDFFFFLILVFILSQMLFISFFFLRSHTEHDSNFVFKNLYS